MNYYIFSNKEKILAQKSQIERTYLGEHEDTAISGCPVKKYAGDGHSRSFGSFDCGIKNVLTLKQSPNKNK